uniref:Aromatic-L-amino-acid decarboxylase n=1 Tax=Parascaris univalens TaxID=6257 RepID=A0A915AUB2_PARUN
MDGLCRAQLSSSSKTSILNAKRVPLFVRDVFNIANFCLGYGGIEEVVKRDIKTVASGTINSDNIGPNETSSSPVAIIDELETIILPMFQQFPKMRSHSFFPGVQSLTDILIEFGCNLLAARGFITVWFKNYRKLQLTEREFMQASCIDHQELETLSSRSIEERYEMLDSRMKRLLRESAPGRDDKSHCNKCKDAVLILQM